MSHDSLTRDSAPIEVVPFVAFPCKTLLHTTVVASQGEGTLGNDCVPLVTLRRSTDTTG